MKFAEATVEKVKAITEARLKSIEEYKASTKFETRLLKVLQSPMVTMPAKHICSGWFPS